MIMREMKDSGISWVGEIPKEWTIMPLYCFYSERKNKNIFGAENNLLSLSYGKVIRKDINTSEGLQPSNYNGYNIVEAGDIIIRPTDLQNDKRSLRTGLSKERGIITSAYIALKPKNGINSRFYHYLLHTYDILKVFYNMGNGVRQGLNYDEFAKLMVYSPSDTEQQRIAEFLDRECGKIDGLKADIQAQIDTLEQYKRSIITEAVTHGLNPSAPMKDSGIPWVGEIPAKWAVLPIYCVYGERKRKNVFGTEQNLLSLSYGKVIRKDINTNGGLLPSNYNGYNIIEKNDIIIRPTDLQNDRTSLRTGLVKEHGIITSAYIALKPKNRVSSKFYHYLLHSYDVKKVFYNMGNGVRQGLNYGEFAKLMVYYPPLDEQQEIADYLDNKCAEIEQIIADKKTQIETLDGYKKSLIYEYVTGKKEVV
jgi:hypothetical protein